MREAQLRPAVSIIVSVYERPGVLELVLESLAHQTFREFEVVVADDGSGPGVRRVIERYAPRLHNPIRHVWHEDRGFRKTVIVNRAVVQAASDYLIFVDGDCMLHHRFVERHHLRRQPSRVLSGRRVMFDAHLTAKITLDDVARRRIEHVGYWWGHAGRTDRWRGFYLPILFWPRNLFRHDYEILGCNFSVHKEDFLKVNGYDERIIGRGLEDNNLCARFLKAGMAIKTVTQEALQYHCHHRADAIPHSTEFVAKFRDAVDAWTPYGIVKG